jgi:fatty acid amide hydrolase 2
VNNISICVFIVTFLLSDSWDTNYVLLQLTSVEVVSSFIGRIRQVNSYINAVVADRFEEALKEAEEVDQLLDSGNLPENLSDSNAPFLGVPVTTKEAISIAGKPHFID